MAQRPKLSVVIPAYNEEDRIRPTIESIDAYLEKQPYAYEVIVVSDGSTDRTVEVVKEYQRATMKELKLNANPINHGKGFAVRDGIGMAEGEYIVFMDADNATRIEEIENFWPWFDKGYDVVFGSRYIKGAKMPVKQPWFRRLAGRLSNLLIQAVILPGIKDTQCGFKAFRRDAARRIFSVSRIDGWGFDIEILALAKKFGYKIKEVPVTWYEIAGTKLKLVRAMIRTLRELLVIKWNFMTGKYKKPPRGLI
jgi:dolichyl-phosphate beta-glucosyltransferase